MKIEIFDEKSLIQKFHNDNIDFDDIKKRIHYFNVNSCLFDKSINYYFCVFTSDTNKIIGIGKLKTGGGSSFSNPNYKNWICFIEVDKHYYGRNISKMILKEIFKFASKYKLDILSSGYTIKGYLYVKPNAIKFANKYDVDYCYVDRVRHPNFSTYEGMNKNEYLKLYDKINHDKSIDADYKYISTKITPT